jgi:hypothetical protein
MSICQHITTKELINEFLGGFYWEGHYTFFEIKILIEFGQKYRTFYKSYRHFYAKIELSLNNQILTGVKIYFEKKCCKE